VRRSQSAERQSSDGSASDSLLPTSPSDPALKKTNQLTIADKWKMAAEYFMLEGGLSLGFHMQRTMRTLMLPEKMQPWNRNSWQQEQLDSLLYLRANKKAEMAASSKISLLKIHSKGTPRKWKKYPAEK
jgi:hypothetical protein